MIPSNYHNAYAYDYRDYDSENTNDSLGYNFDHSFLDFSIFVSLAPLSHRRQVFLKKSKLSLDEDFPSELE